MVGVAGKSKACHDCKRRRVKCDLTRPACLRCGKAGITCRGYEKVPPLFVNRTLAAPSTTALSAMASNASQRPSEAPKRTAQDWLLILQQLKSEVSCRSCPLTEFRSHTWTLLKELYLPRTRTLDGSNGVSSPAYSWLQAVCEMRGRSDSLDHSLLAFCAIQVHMVKTGRASTDEGLQLYNHALQELLKDLEDGIVRNNDETLAAIVVLSTCELFVNSNDQGWRAHTHGISELLRHRSQSNFTSQVWESLSSRLRIICVLQALSDRRALALGADRWRQLISVDSTAESFQGMMDILSDVPLLLEEIDAVLTSPEKKPPSQISTLFLALFRTLEKLDNWQQLFRRSFAKTPYWAVPARSHNPSDDDFSSPLFPFALEYESLDIAMPMMLSSGVMLQILATILQLEATSGFFNDFTDAFDIKDNKYTSMSAIRAEADKLARFICQSMEYFHRIDMGTLGPQSTCYAQWITRCYFRQVGLERELNWCKNIKNMSGPDSHCGIELMLFGEEANRPELPR